MADAVDVRVVHHAEDPLGRAAVERGVERGDHPVELGEHVVVDVERAVGPDVRLDPAEHAKRLQARVDLVDLLPLRLEPAVAEVVRVVGEAQEPVAAALRGERHLLDRALAVRRPGRVAVHLAAEVAELDERRKLAVSRRRDLGRPLAELGRRRAVAEVRVELVLARVRDDLARSRRSVTPYSEIESPRRCASSRSAMLWSFEPVKCWRTLP